MSKVSKKCQPSLLSQNFLLAFMSQFGQICGTLMEVFDKTEWNLLSSQKKYTQKLGSLRPERMAKHKGSTQRWWTKGRNWGKKRSQCARSHPCPKWHPRVWNSCHWQWCWWCTQRYNANPPRKQRFPQIWPWNVSLTTQNSTIAKINGGKGF